MIIPRVVFGVVSLGSVIIFYPVRGLFFSSSRPSIIGVHLIATSPLVAVKVVWRISIKAPRGVTAHIWRWKARKRWKMRLLLVLVSRA